MGPLASERRSYGARQGAGYDELLLQVARLFRSRAARIRRPAHWRGNPGLHDRPAAV